MCDKKFWVKIMLFGTVLSMILIRLNTVFILKEYPMGPNVNETIKPYILTEKNDGFYAMEKNSLDVVFIGSSNIHCNINPNVIWNEYGIASYDFSSDMQDLGTSYYYLKQMFKRQSPAVVVIDVWEDGNVEEIDSLAAHFAFDHMKLDKVKIEAVYNRAKENWLEMLFPLITYHERWKELKQTDFSYKKRDYNILKGSVIYMVTNEKPKPKLPEHIESSKLPERTMFWLDSIIKLCNDNNCECIFIKTPYSYCDEIVFSYLEGMQNYCNERKIPFLYMNKLVDQIGIDFTNDYVDEVHLNWNGQVKLSNYSGEYISSNYHIKNKCKDKEFQKWNDDYEEMMWYVDNFEKNYSNMNKK